MKESIFVFLSLTFVFTACRKDDPIPLAQGAFVAASITENMPVRAFTKNGEITNPTAINKVLNDYDNYIPESWDISFTATELPEGQIRIHDSFIECPFLGEMIKYDYIRNNDVLFLEMQDSITIAANYSDYYIQLFNAINVYPLPEFRKYYVPTQTGFYIENRYQDKRYIKIIDENTIRMHIARYLYVVNYTIPAYQAFWILPVELNNYFKETGYPAIKEEDAILVKEFGIEYRKNVP